MENTYTIEAGLRPSQQAIVLFLLCHYHYNRYWGFCTASQQTVLHCNTLNPSCIAFDLIHTEVM